ncbi:MAG: MFS transporter [Acidobacteriaceae bacterium]|nr:MFS transporter [Acidobacteriaceae bacterium]
MRWLLIFWIFLVSAVAYLDRVNISIAGRSIAQEFHLSDIQLGGVFSAFVLGYAAAQAPAGWLADRIGPRLILLIGVVWWAVFTSLITVISPKLREIFLIAASIRFCLGVGEAVVYPASNCIVAAWMPSSERGLANGWIFSGVGFGAGVTPPLITYIMIHYGWRASFWCSAGLGLMVGAIWFLVARNNPRQHPWVTEKELALIEAGLPAGESGIKNRLSWSAILTNGDVLLITFSYFTYGYVAYIFFSWFFIYLNEIRHLNLRQSSLYTMLPFLAMTAGSLLGGWISDRLTRSLGKRAGRCGVAAFGIGLAAIFLALGTQAQSAQLATFTLAGGAGALYLAQSSFWSMSADIGGPSAGSVSGLMNAGGQIGAAVTVSLTPAIALHSGWNASFLAAAGLCACGSLAWVFVRPAE